MHLTQGLPYIREMPDLDFAGGALEKERHDFDAAGAVKTEPRAHAVPCFQDFSAFGV